MGTMKQQIKEAIAGGGGIGFPVLEENDLKGRIDRMEAALEIQLGWVLAEKTSGKKDKGKKGHVESRLIVGLGILAMVGIFAFGAENVVVRYIAGEGNDATITLESDQGDDASDEAQFTMGDDGLLDLSVGGTDIVSIGSGLSALVNVSLDTASAVTCTADGAAATGVYGNHHYNNAAQVMTYTLPPVAAGMIVTIGNSDIGAANVTTIEIDAADKIALNGVLLDAGDTIDSPGAAGASITLVGLDTVRWLTIRRVGTWVDGGP
jgi:hypothetical protein